MNRKTGLLVLGLLALTLLAPACAPPTPSKPNIILVSPPNGSEFRPGDNVAVQCVATDETGIVRVELVDDGALVRVDAAPGSPTSFNFIQNWNATPGANTLAVRAFNRAGVANDTASVSISVLPVAAAGAPTISARAVPTPLSVPFDTSQGVAQSAPTNTTAATRAPTASA